MATIRVLSIVAGKIAEYVAAIVSTGAGSSGQLVALNGAGQVDVTMMPTGIGPDVQALPATENLSAGALVNFWSNGGVFSMRNADGSTAGKEADGFVLSAVATGATGTAYMAGINTAVSGLVPGLVYLSDTSVGSTAAVGATTAGHTFQQVGVALSATSYQFSPQVPIVRA